MRVLLFCIVLLLGHTAQAQDALGARGGQFLTVRVQGAPLDIAAAHLDLNSSLCGIKLRSEGDGVWTGGFVMLPNMVAGTIRPEVRLFRGDRLEQVATQEGLSVEMASSDFDHEGLAVVLSDPGATFVFDSTIETESINFMTGEGYAVPDLSTHTFTLPGRVSPGQVSSIVAQTKEGVDLIFSPSWGTLPSGSNL